jgi:hypothetical protein
MRRFSCFSEIIDAFGVSAVAEVINKDESHVRTMKARDSIPPEYWGLLVEAAPSKGIEGLNYDVFVGLRSKRFAQQDRTAASLGAASAEVA